MGHRVRQSQVIKMLLSLPKDVRSWAEAKADQNLSSMNAVIVAAVRSQMMAEQSEEREREEKAVEAS
jgi:hypothetical protein